jgi:hypothetical protein
MIPSHPFPRLTPENHRVTSPETAEYNCIAWAAHATAHCWQPGVHWPGPAEPDDYGIEALQEAFRTLGFEPCMDGSLESGFEKVALYGDQVFYTHAARQLPNGKWTSKLGEAEDIEHDAPEDVAFGVYGQVVQFMRRAVVQG